MSKVDLAKIFGVEGLITPKTLITETPEDVRKKSAGDMALDVRALLDEMDVRVVSQDIVGIIQCIEAGILRLEEMHKVMINIRDYKEPGATKE